MLIAVRRIAIAVTLGAATAVGYGAPDTPAVPSDAAVAEVHAAAYGVMREIGIPIWRCSQCVIPLKGGTTTPDGQLLGVLHGKRGGSARVVARNVDDGKLRFRVQATGTAADFEGTIQLGRPDQKQTPIKLVVTVKDEPLLPLLTLGLGIWLALLLKRQVGVIRSVWILRQREAALALAFRKSHSAFTHRSAGQPYGKYDISAAFEEARQKLVLALDGLEAASRLSLDTSTADYKSTIGTFERLDRIVASWSSFAARAAKAAVAAVTVRTDAADLPRLSGTEEIQLAQALDELLEGRTLDLEAYEAVETRMAATTSFAAEWSKLAHRIARVSDAADELKNGSDISDDDMRLIAASRDQLAGAVQLIKEAIDSETLKAATDAVVAAERTLAPVRARHGILHRGEMGQLLRTLRGPRSIIIRESDAAEEAPPPPEDPERRLAFYRRQQLRWDRAMTWIACGVALVTGLQKFYLDKPFGTPGDYLNLLLVGLATRAAVEAIATAFDWYRAGPARG
jgi:hypothetical protein